MDSRIDDCSLMGGEIPLSSTFFKVIKSELWLYLVPAVLAVLLLALFLEEVGFFLRHEPSVRRRNLCLWILGMYPVFGMTSIIALYVPRSSSLCNFIASLYNHNHPCGKASNMTLSYHSSTLLKFMGLIESFFGGKARMLEVLAGEKVSPNPFPCCCCCCFPLINITSTNLRWMMIAVLQLSVVRTLLFFITLVLWTDEQYDYGGVDSVDPNIYINAIIGVSTFLSFYGYLLFYKATRKALHGYGLRAKFICIIVVLVLCGLQNGILETTGALKVIPCAPPFSALFRSQLIYHYAVIVEMFCISLFARNIFRKLELSPEYAYELEEGLTHHKEVQTEDVLPLAVQLSSQTEDPSCSNPAYSSDSEDSLCRIEHAPLDHFPFPLQSRHLQFTQSESDSVKLSEECKSTESPTITVNAEINYVENLDVTVV